MEAQYGIIQKSIRRLANMKEEKNLFERHLFSSQSVYCPVLDFWKG